MYKNVSLLYMMANDTSKSVNKLYNENYTLFKMMISTLRNDIMYNKDKGLINDYINFTQSKIKESFQYIEDDKETLDLFKKYISNFLFSDYISSLIA